MKDMPQRAAQRTAELLTYQLQANAPHELAGRTNSPLFSKVHWGVQDDTLAIDGQKLALALLTPAEQEQLAQEYRSAAARIPRLAEYEMLKSRAQYRQMQKELRHPDAADRLETILARYRNIYDVHQLGHPLAVRVMDRTLRKWRPVLHERLAALCGHVATDGRRRARLAVKIAHASGTGLYTNPASRFTAPKTEPVPGHWLVSFQKD